MSPSPIPLDPLDPLDPLSRMDDGEAPDPVADVRRPLLRPGLLVTRRDDRHLQVGLDPGLAVPATEANRRLLADLVAGRPVGPVARRTATWRRLVMGGHLVDGDDLAARLPADDEASRAVAAAYAELGSGAGAALDRRARTRVAVHAPGRWQDEAVGLLTAVGLGGGSSTQPHPDAALVVALGTPDRGRLDRLVQDDTPYLLVTGVDGGVEVGPFVVPGLTACLRCVDATLAETDPQRGLVVDQLARHGTRRGDGVPTPVEPALTTLAVAWAVRELTTYVDGGTPTTWSASVRLGPGAEQRWRRWRRHPRCGCAWLALEEAE